MFTSNSTYYSAVDSLTLERDAARNELKEMREVADAEKIKLEETQAKLIAMTDKFHKQKRSAEAAIREGLSCAQMITSYAQAVTGDEKRIARGKLEDHVEKMISNINYMYNGKTRDLQNMSKLYEAETKKVASLQAELRTSNETNDSTSKKLAGYEHLSQFVENIVQANFKKRKRSRDGSTRGSSSESAFQVVARRPGNEQ